LTLASFTAFYDADVLYGSQLRNLMMHLAMTGLFRARWSDGVHEEWMTRLLENRPDLTREKLERTRMLMDKHAQDSGNCRRTGSCVFDLAAARNSRIAERE